MRVHHLRCLKKRLIYLENNLLNQFTHQKMKWPISSHNNQVEHHAPYHHAECQHKLVEACPAPSVLPVSLPLVVAAFVEPVGVALSFAAAGRIVAAAAVAGERTAAAVADIQHYIAAAVAVLGRILLERTCCCYRSILQQYCFMVADLCDLDFHR